MYYMVVYFQLIHNVNRVNTNQLPILSDVINSYFRIVVIGRNELGI